MAQRLSLPEVRRQAKISEQHSRSRREIEQEELDGKYSRQFVTIVLISFLCFIGMIVFFIFDNGGFG